MRLYQRACLVVANEGLSGLSRRVLSRVGGAARGREAAAPPAPARPDFPPPREFFDRARALGHGDLENYYWYHTIDLGGGLVTPGTYDYRESLDAFGFPPDMRGLNVLDVGSATGFFAFEFERRGARVVSVEIASIADWDRFPGDTAEQTVEKFKRAQDQPGEQRNHLLRARTLEEVHHLMLDGPFEFCRKVLGSKVERRYARVYDLSKQTLGRDDFDIVFLGDILLHTINPLAAAAAAASVCRGTLIVAQEMPEAADARPAVFYVGGDRQGEDAAVWWLPNRPCVEQILRKLGFAAVEVVGRNRGFTRPTGSTFDRPVIHARRG